eukprot:CAMPEP_0194151820 /NCGR_PEP_ID=MMETSP0152-20130528/49649_1 /TAXON_ID=1049557 /ORGANISM="Thalassiothrix antarctica, Strain L6-D1" /LENGTH=242 /DNA_ID=CAMNT_0038855903 /DNA_START=33 /DNA_END=761 /DNA_ORIENTATION=-
MKLLLQILLLFVLQERVESFVLPRQHHHSSSSSSTSFTTSSSTTTLGLFNKNKKIKNNNKRGIDEDLTGKSNWTFNPFDVTDLSPLDTLLRRGFIPFSVRLTQNSKYETSVLNYMETDRCDRATAQRNMDAYFCDPNGWVISKQRTKNLGENFGDINGPTGVQKRPIFSFIWGTFTVWAIFVFFPGKIAANGGIHPSGFCVSERVVVNGKKICPQYTPNVFANDQAFLNRVLIQESRENGGK